MRNEISALFLAGKRVVKVYIKRVKNAESDAEFWGRALCVIEDCIKKELNIKSIPAGFKWVQWGNDGHTFNSWRIIGSPELYTHTGNLYQDRYTRAYIPGYSSAMTDEDAVKFVRRLLA